MMEDKTLKIQKDALNNNITIKNKYIAKEFKSVYNFSIVISEVI